MIGQSPVKLSVYHFHSGAPDPVLSNTKETTRKILVTDRRDDSDWETTNDSLQRDGWSSRTTSVFSPVDVLRSRSINCSGDWIPPADGPSDAMHEADPTRSWLGETTQFYLGSNTIFDLGTSASWQETPVEQRRQVTPASSTTRFKLCESNCYERLFMANSNVQLSVPLRNPSDWCPSDAVTSCDVIVATTPWPSTNWVFI